MINLLEFDESASDKNATNYCNTYFNHELLRARPTTLQTTIQVLSWSQSSLPHLSHFATHEG